MNFSQAASSFFIPDGEEGPEALTRTTHLGIGAHQDDLEFMAFHGILSCYERQDEWFAGVICTDGSGSPRAGEFTSVSDEEMKSIRRIEQNQAAQIGRYGAMIQLDHPSVLVRDSKNKALIEDLINILQVTKPRVVYTHNLADKHETHVAVGIKTIQAIRLLPLQDRPEALYGCEVWRGLDWLPDTDKVIHDLSGYDKLAEKLNGVFVSQIASGKRYDLGVIGRRLANATFLSSHSKNEAESVSYAMDLTTLIRDESLDIASYVGGFLDSFQAEVIQRLK